MKRILLFLVTVLIIGAAAAFGVSKRATYTDLTAQEGYLNQLQVAELTKEPAGYACEAMREALPESPVIAKVKVTGGYEPLFGAGRQKAQVVTVYAGQELTAGQELYVCSEAWVISLYGEPKALERNFENIMRTGEEYLIFGSEVLEDFSGDLPAIKLNEVRFISPVFAYKDFEHVILPIGESHTYVPYFGVKDNEFFPQSPETLALWQELKADMLAAYP